MMSSTEFLQSAHDHQQAGRLEEAEAQYRRAIESNGADVEARLNLGIVLHDRGRLVESAEVLGQLVADRPENAAAWVYLARAIAPQGYGWEAHQAIARAMKGKPDTETLLAASRLLMSLHHIPEADKASKRAAELSPQSAAAWIQRGQILTLRGRKPDAVAAYLKALAIEPKNAVAEFFLAAMGTKGIPVAGAPAEYVRSLFDGYAERFESLLVGSLKYQTPVMLAEMLAGWLGRAAGELPRNTPRTMVMLDAGCGTGLCGAWMAQYRGKLIGVDLAPLMIAKARERKVYDELVAGDIVAELGKRAGELDLVVAADVLVYLGDLTNLFGAVAGALRPGGMFAFSVEAAADGEFRLLATQRFSHSMAYLRRLAFLNGLTVNVTREAVIRQEKGEDVKGYLMLLTAEAGRTGPN
jgi:predicted TPR repeat methyltransferase